MSILGFENCQSFFSYNCPCTYGVPQCAAHRNARRTAMRGAPQCAERTSLIGTTLAKLSKQLRNITYRQLFNKHTILSCLFLKMVVYCNKQLCKKNKYMHIHIQLLMRPVPIDGDDYLLCIQKSAPSTSFFKRKCNNIYF